MASGKQLTFQFGEVSPSLRFRSDAVSYSAGLSTLKNMYVRKAGGVSNRAGFKYEKTASSQLGIPDEGQNPGVKAFTFWDSVDEEWKTLEYRQISSTPTYGLYIGSTLLTGISTITSPTPDLIKFTVLKEHVLISPSITTTFDQTILYVMGTTNVTTIATPLFPSPSTGGKGQGYAPFLPVTYLVTATLKNGEEVFVYVVNTSGYTASTWNVASYSGGANVFHPHASWSNNFTYTWTSVSQPYLDNVRFFNLYRASGAQGYSSSFFKLAARVPYSSGLTITFNDYGGEDASVTPSLESEMYANGLALSGVTCACYYQQRLVYVLKPGTVDVSKAGDVYVSKIGAPLHVRTPVIYRDTEAFQFSVPVTDGTPVIGLLSLERLIAFTERGVYVIRGGEQGILTPTQVNPLKISDEGCSKTVEPKTSGRRGYFLNNSHTKLMSITFGDDGNLTVSDASIVSDHLLQQEDIVQLEAIGGIEDIVYLLRRDGRMIQITCHEDGSHGFSLIETNGYIESIYRGKDARKYSPKYTPLLELQLDVLMAYVVRNGVRTLEKMEIRNDDYPEAEAFADCFRNFGNRLSDYGSNGYAQIRYDGTVFSNRICNLVSFTGIWSEGTVIKLRSNSNFLDGEDASHLKVRFFYEEDEEIKLLDFNWNGVNALPSGDATFPYEYLGTFDKDVPSSLQNVKAQTLSTIEKKKRYTRWLLAYDKLETGTPHGDYVLTGPHLANLKNLLDTQISTVVFADGKVISSPLDENKTPLYIEDNGITFSIQFPEFYTYGYLGAPYESDFETLDLEATDARTFTDARKLLNAVGVAFQNTRGGYFGIENAEIDDMAPISPTSYSPFNTEEENDNFNGHISIPIPTQWSERGRVRIRQIDPLPITVLAVYPKGVAGD